MFQESSRDVYLTDGHILHAECRVQHGKLKPSEIDLNTLIGNSNGQFTWYGRNFSDNARDVRIEFEGPEQDVPVLHAELDDGNGNMVPSSIDLGYCIKNVTGDLESMHC